MAEFEIIATAVLTYLGAGATKVAMVPWEEAADRFRKRIRRVGVKAQKKSGGRPLEFNERVAFKALSEAAFTDDEIVSDYLGGVLAAAGPDDDAGAAIVAQVGRLSSIQLHFHYVVYRELRRLWPEDAPLNLYQEGEARTAGIFMTGNDLLASCGMRLVTATGSVIGVLVREGLLNEFWEWTCDETAEGPVRMAARVRPTALGAELFLWGHGCQDVNANNLLKSGIELPFLTDVAPMPHTALINPPKPPEAVP